MKYIGTILFFLISYQCWSQKIEVIVPTQPVVVGTAFQVQYIITEPSEFVAATTPVFDSCRLISGPNIYKGNAVVDGKLQPIQNITYTLVPTQTGVLRIGSIKASYKNFPDEQSFEAGITVVPQPKASFSVRSSYTDIALYAPSSKKGREQLIDENLFIKTVVNKKICYEGEPVVVTFKLYSRLQSASEARRSPAFYGFSVVDILNINEAHTAVETVNGKIFNTSVLRKVQLYPVQSGMLTIDGMYVQNEIEFDDSITHAKTKVEKEIVTEPIVITIKPLPQKKPEDFTGAVGKFLMEAYLEKDQLAQNGQGKLIVKVKGKGNFIQFGQPLVPWPEGVEPFEPVITDQLNKNTAPIEGTRTYEFGFAVDAVGGYTLPALSFSYFDIDENSFRRLNTDSLQLTVLEATEKTVIDAAITKSSFPYVLLILSVSVIGIAAVLFFKKRKPKPEVKENIFAPAKTNYVRQLASLNLNQLTGKQTCIEVQRIVSAFSKEYSSSLTLQQKQEALAILQECELTIYSRIESEEKKTELVTRTMKLLHAVSSQPQHY
jgi:hypothetical protein